MLLIPFRENRRSHYEKPPQQYDGLHHTKIPLDTIIFNRSLDTSLSENPFTIPRRKASFKISEDATATGDDYTSRMAYYRLFFLKRIGQESNKYEGYYTAMVMGFCKARFKELQCLDLGNPVKVETVTSIRSALADLEIEATKAWKARKHLPCEILHRLRDTLKDLMKIAEEHGIATHPHVFDIPSDGSVSSDTCPEAKTVGLFSRFLLREGVFGMTWEVSKGWRMTWAEIMKVHLGSGIGPTGYMLCDSFWSDFWKRMTLDWKKELGDLTLRRRDQGPTRGEEEEMKKWTKKVEWREGRDWTIGSGHTMEEWMDFVDWMHEHRGMQYIFAI